MRTNSELLSPANRLLRHGRALWVLAYVFAKTMTLAQYRDRRAAHEKAEMLEMWSRFALFTFIGQIAAIETSGARLSKDDKICLAHCRAIVGALAMLCALAAKVRRESSGLARIIPFALLRDLKDNQALTAANNRDIGYLDSS